MTISWNTGAAAMRFRHNLKLKKKRRPAAKAASSKRQAASSKRQAPSLTVTEGYYRMIKKEKYESRKTKKENN